MRQGLKCAGNVRVLFRLGGLAHRDYLRSRLLQILLHLGQRVPLLGLVNDGVPFEDRQAIVPGDLHGPPMTWPPTKNLYALSVGESPGTVNAGRLRRLATLSLAPLTRVRFRSGANGPPNPVAKSICGNLVVMQFENYPFNLGDAIAY